MISCRRCFLAAPLSLPRISGPTLPSPLQLRSTRGALSDVSGSGGQGVQLGVSGEPFTFESHARARGVKVATATVSGGCSTQSNQDQISAVVSGALAADVYAPGTDSALQLGELRAAGCMMALTSRSAKLRLPAAAAQQ